MDRFLTASGRGGPCPDCGGPTTPREVELAWVITGPGRSTCAALRQVFSTGLFGDACCGRVRVEVSPTGADFRGCCPDPHHAFHPLAEFKLYCSPLHWPTVPGKDAWRLVVDLGFIKEKPPWWDAVPDECWTVCIDPEAHAGSVHPIYRSRIVWPQPVAYLWQWAHERADEVERTNPDYARLTVLVPQPGDVNELWWNSWGLDVEAGLVRRCLPSQLADTLASIEVPDAEQSVVNDAITALWVGTTWADAEKFGPAAFGRVYDDYKAPFDISQQVHLPGRCRPA